MSPVAESRMAWYTGQPSQYGPRMLHSRRSASLSSRNAPLRVPTSNNVFGMSPPGFALGRHPSQTAEAGQTHRRRVDRHRRGDDHRARRECGEDVAERQPDPDGGEREAAGERDPEPRPRRHAVGGAGGSGEQAEEQERADGLRRLRGDETEEPEEHEAEQADGDALRRGDSGVE